MPEEVHTRTSHQTRGGQRSELASLSTVSMEETYLSPRPSEPENPASHRIIVTTIQATPKGSIDGERVKHTAIEGYYALCKARRWRDWSVRGVTRDSVWRKEKYEREIWERAEALT